MIRARLAVAVLFCVPVLASAQRGGMGGSKETDWNAVAGKGGAAGPTISQKDFENVSPFKLLLDKKKDLKLTDAQMTALKDSDAALKEANRTRFVALDSLKRDAKPRTSGTPSAVDETRMAIARDGLQSVVREVQASYDTAAETVLPMLDEAQRLAGQKVLDKYSEEMRDMLREKAGGRSSGGGGGRGSRGRGSVQGLA